MNEKKTKKLEIITINSLFKEGEKVLSKANPKTILHAHEIIKERETARRNQSSNNSTVDFAMYRMENDEAILYLAPRKHNLIFQNIKDALNQLKSTGNYVPTQEGIDQVVNSAKTGKTLRVNLSKLGLTITNTDFENPELKVIMKNNGEYNSENYFYHQCKKMIVYNPLNKSEKLLVERIYGKGKSFKDYKEKAHSYGLTRLEIQVLNPKYVKEHAKDKAIGRMSYIGGNYYTFFDATCQDIRGNLSFYRKPLT